MVVADHALMVVRVVKPLDRHCGRLSEKYLCAGLCTGGAEGVAHHRLGHTLGWVDGGWVGLCTGGAEGVAHHRLGHTLGWVDGGWVGLCTGGAEGVAHHGLGGGDLGLVRVLPKNLPPTRAPFEESP